MEAISHCENASAQSLCDTADVVIVGAGPTGLTLANLLGSYGVDTLLVERNRTTVGEPRAVSIDDESMRTMQAIGLSDKVEAITARGYGSRYYAPNGQEFARVDPVSRDYGFDKRNAFQQPELEALLRRNLARYSCVRATFGVEAVDLENRPDHVRLRVQPEAGQDRAVMAKYLVGCDGGRSFVRKSLGIDLVGSTFSERWLILDLHETRNRFRHTEVFCDPARSCITLPGPDGIRRYEFMLHAHEGEEVAEDEDFVRSLLAAVGPDHDAPIRRSRVYTFHARLAERWSEGRVFLAGDAAHLTPPFAGQGMNSGLRDAHNLAWKLAAALRNGADTRLLDTYETERRSHAWSMIELAMTMGKVMMPTSPLRGALTRAGFHLLGLCPPARDYVVQMRYKPEPYFKAGLIWPDGRSTKSTLVGKLLPQPVVERPDRTRLLLDNVIANVACLIILSEMPDAAANAALLKKAAAKNLHLIGITPEWVNPRPAPFQVLRDVTRQLSGKRFKSYLEHAILVRPDHYVAATAPLSKAEALIDIATQLSVEDRSEPALTA